jgi:DNA invertase Pin-like site-specific DNA recombinase
MDTTTPQGAFLFHVFGVLAQYERALTQERIKAGLAAAKRRGKRGGRPQAISDEKLAAIRAALGGGASTDGAHRLRWGMMPVRHGSCCGHLARLCACWQRWIGAEAYA